MTKSTDENIFDWLIVFPNPWILYSPSILNFVEMLKQHNNRVLVIFISTNIKDELKLGDDFKAVYIKPELLKNLNRLRAANIFTFFKLMFFTFKLKYKYKFKNILGVDIISYLALRINYTKVKLYSLEINRYLFAKFIKMAIKPDLGITQNLIRKEYMFSKKVNTIILPNSPILSYKARVAKSYSGRLVYFGNLIKSHGIEECIQVLYQLNNETLTIKLFHNPDMDYLDSLLSRHKELIEAGRLFFNFEYISQDKINDYLSLSFDVGLCLLNDELIKSGDFNYLSGDYGKAHNYIAAGLPVLGSKTIGLQYIETVNAGILVNSASTQDIKNAILKIEADYENLSKNAFKASEDYDFKRNFINNLTILS
jgi:glycosyltransferase involved in cell wall biosynthesis